MRSTSFRVITAWLAGAGLTLTPAAWAQAPGGAAPAKATPPPAIEEQPIEIVREMSARLAKAERLRVTVEVAYDAVQRDGQVIEYGARRRVAIRRPDRFRLDAVSRDGARRVLVYDGKQIALADLDHNVYATAARSGDVDATLAYLSDELDVPTPLAELFARDLPELLAKESQSARWVGEQTIDGVVCDHLAFRNAEVGVQLWVPVDGEPLPRRLVIAYERARGRPQFRADLREWDLSPRLPDSLFAFEPAKGAERIYFRAGNVVLPGMEGTR
jgi:hypothetical protein